MTRHDKAQKSWVRRRRRRIRLIILILVCVLLCGIGVVLFNASLPYEEVDLCDLYTIRYDGFDTGGTAEAVMDAAKVDELLSNLRDEHNSRLIKLSKVQAEDYVNFRNSLNATVTPDAKLANGSTVTLTVNYDTDIAKRLKLDISSVTSKTTVNGLERATLITEEQLFADVSVMYEGISPSITPVVVNNSVHPYLEKVTYVISEPKNFYAEGDVFDVCALLPDDEALNNQYVVNDVTGRIRQYTVHSDMAYVTNPDDIRGNVLDTAISVGKGMFNNANEYGVRIFCEGNLVPVYVNKQPTFEWGEPRVLSAYFKTVHASEIGSLGNNMNDLDIIYEVRLSQSNGVACTSYCVVRYSNFIRNADGVITYDYSSGKIVSASFYAERVKKNAVEAYTDTYDITKLL